MLDSLVVKRARHDLVSLATGQWLEEALLGWVGRLRSIDLGIAVLIIKVPI